MKNGTLLDSSWSNDRLKIYNLFVKYFEDPILTKIKDDQISSTYMVKCKSMLNASRYVVIVCDKDSYKKGTLFKLSQLKWQTLQTRELTNIYDIHEHIYSPKNISPFNQSIECNLRTSFYTTYSTPYKFTISLLHPEEEVYYYPNKGTIASALETYRTIVDIST